MSEQTTPFRDNTLNLDQAYYYTLLLLIDTNTFSYAIIFRTKILAYGGNYPLSELSDARELQELLSAPYKKVIFGFQANGFTLVPHNVFNADHIANFARVLDVAPNEKVLGQVLDDQNYVIYKVDENNLAVVDKFNFKDITLTAKGLIKLIAQNNPQDTDFYINFTADSMQFIYFQHGELRYYNQFKFKSEEDVVYYTAVILNELSLQIADATLVISGEINSGDNLYMRLHDFFPNVSINKIQLLEIPSQYRSHNLLPLASLSLCESSEAL